MYRRLLLAALLFSPAHLPAQTPVAIAQKSLLKLAAPEMTGEVPAPIRSAIVTLKQALAEQTDAALATVPIAGGTVAAKRTVSAALPAESVGTRTDAKQVAPGDRSGDAPVAGMYGGGLHVDVTQPRPDLLLVLERFDIACGSDNLLLAYRAEAGHWKRILRWDSGPYDQISGAFGDSYEARILRPMRNGHPLLLVLHGTPWCTSTMSSFKMDVFELVAHTDKPFWHDEHGYRRADRDPPLTLKPMSDGFQVRTSVTTFTTDANGVLVSRDGIMRYEVGKDGIHRVVPIALNARDSLEEWLSMSRQEACDFADETTGSPTWKMFDSLSWRGVNDADIEKHWTADYGAVRECSDDRKHFQIDVATSRGYGTKQERGTTYYVQMKQVPNGYRIHAATLRPDVSCTGPDLMAKP